MMKQQDLLVRSLGECRISSPLRFGQRTEGRQDHFVSDSTRLCVDLEVKPETPSSETLSFEEAGPRKRIYFDPERTTAAIVTCGGLSPGLNNVIRSVFFELTVNYGVPKVLGIRNGYLGLNPSSGLQPITLVEDFAQVIDKLGGTALGTSRGGQEASVMVDSLVEQQINMLFCVGGDGTQRGAHALHQEVLRRGLDIAVIGIPKTIDNDIAFVRQSFGYNTALEKAAEVVRGAHIEARGAVRGIGLVKLMGRDAGFITAGATVVSQEVNFALVPEVRFPLEGEGGFLAALQGRMQRRGHAVVVVAEGAGQHLVESTALRRDASGNRLHEDIGLFLRARIREHFSTIGRPVDLKYIDPSYYIRSVPANVYDRYLCDQMGRHAVHAAMAGKTGMLIGFEHDRFINVPIPIVVAQKKRMDVAGDLWRAVLQVTRQPHW